MKKYRVLKDYRSHMAQLCAGDVVEFIEQLADWFNRDAPGTLEEIKPEVKKPEPPEAPQVDRMVKAPGRKRK